MIRAVLFDVGGPLDTEEIAERLIDRDIAAALASEGVTVSKADVDGASGAAVASFAPDAYRAMIWKLAGGDEALAVRVYRRFASQEARTLRQRERGGIEWRDGIAELLRTLADDGMLLGLAANQPASVLGELEGAGLADVFVHREVSGHHGLYKPDLRLFLRACSELEVRPDECVMVGDRIDNDIAPARALGMATVLIRTGRHRTQQPRSWDEQPHITTHDVRGVRDAIARLRQG